MPSNGGFVKGVRGDFLLYSAVVDGKSTQPKRIQNAEDCAQKVMPKGTKVLSAERSGMSAWTRTGLGEKRRVIYICQQNDHERLFELTAGLVLAIPTYAGVGPLTDQTPSPLQKSRKLRRATVTLPLPPERRW